jgi:putative ABC transport system substrate-binding protein
MGETRRRLIGSMGLVLVAPAFAWAQGRTVRIGFLGLNTAAELANLTDGMRRGLAEHGYVEGKNLVIEWRWAESRYERLPDLAADLVRQKVDVIVTHGTPGTLAAKKATTTIPIVMAIAGDAVVTGLVASVARPGGNVAGSTYFSPELMAKRLDLLRLALPRLTRVGVLVNPSNPTSVTDIAQMAEVAQSSKIELLRFGARTPGEFDKIFAEMQKQRVQAMALQEDGMLNSNAKAVAVLTARYRMPSAGLPELAEAGGVIGYGVNRVEIWRRVGYFVDRILKGANPGELPIEQASKFDLLINRRAASAMGVSLPEMLLLRADRVIE